MALSTTEAKFIALTESIKEARWIKGLVGEVRITQDNVIVFCDSQSEIELSKHQVYHEKSKHIDVDYTSFEMLLKPRRFWLRKF